MELETVNKLYLELSQIATATTAREASLANKAARFAALLWDRYDVCPECGGTKDQHMPACAQTYAREFNGPADFQRVFNSAFGHGA